MLIGDCIVMFLTHRVCCKNGNVIYFRDFGKINTLHSCIFINKYAYSLRSFTLILVLLGIISSSCDIIFRFLNLYCQSWQKLPARRSKLQNLGNVSLSDVKINTEKCPDSNFV